MKIHLLSLILVCLALGADEPTPVAPQLVDIFQASEFPGSGALSYKQDDENSEKIELGKTTGFYGLGMIFNGKVLPEPFRKDFAQNQILQVVLGSLKGKEEGRLPQFAAVTLLATKIPTQKTLFRLAIPNSSELKKGPVAILLFTSPSLKQGGADEEKLKETVFAESGSIIVTPLGRPTVSVIKSKGAKYSFFRQEMKMDWSGKLTTPFSTTNRSVVGSTQFPFFWPKDRAAEKLANGIAAESLNSVGAGSKGFSSKKPKP